MTRPDGRPGTPAPADRRLAALLDGYRHTALVYVAAELGVADQLAAGPRSAAEVAAAVGAQPDQLHQVLRALAGLGVLRHDEDGTFALAEVGELLRTDHPESRRGMAIYFGGLSYRAYTGLLGGLTSGGIAFDQVFGTSYYEYLNEHPALAEHYHRMIALPPGLAPVIGALFDFTPYRSIVDVGGGNGSMLAEILSLAPQARGVLYDLPVSVESAEQVLTERGLRDRCEIAPGDFRVSVPAGGDVYLLSRVLANWPADLATKILANCRAAMPPQARLLIFELMMPERVEEGVFVVEGDMNALAHMGGGVRSRSAFTRLLTDGGFRLDEVRRVSPDLHWSLLVCSPVVAG